MHARLKALLLRRKPRDEASQLDLIQRPVSVESKDLGERLTDAIAAADCDPVEAEYPEVLAYVRATTAHLDPNT